MYAELLKRAYAAVKQGNPSAQSVSPASSLRSLMA
jgi:hypothetical protein